MDRITDIKVNDYSYTLPNGVETAEDCEEIYEKEIDIDSEKSS